MAQVGNQATYQKRLSEAPWNILATKPVLTLIISESPCNFGHWIINVQRGICLMTGPVCVCLQKIQPIMRRKERPRPDMPQVTLKNHRWLFQVVKFKDTFQGKKQKLPNVPISSIPQSQSIFSNHDVYAFSVLTRLSSFYWLLHFNNLLSIEQGEFTSHWGSLHSPVLSYW